jgi:hypothetical protein
MADSAFWRDLAEKFLALPDFRADGHYVIGSGQPWAWQLAGVASEYIRSAFEALARRAAAALAGGGAPDLLIVWLEELRKGSYNFRFSNQAYEVQPDGTEGPHYLMGSIHGVCHASATLCKKLEAEAVQAEFEAAQRNNPKNWTQFRQQFEALKSMREIHDAPAERIPEDFARNAIARIYGIKPEDVTTEQIAFEVAGLLPAYPHIELIPSAPIPSAPIEAPKSAPETERSYVGIDNSRSSHPSPEPVPPPIAPGETIAAQLQRLRKECNWSADRLAEAVKFDPRTVTRHLSGETVPHLRNISAYERVFSKQLKRQVVINKMP